MTEAPEGRCSSARANRHHCASLCPYPTGAGGRAAGQGAWHHAAQCTWERTARATIAVYERVLVGEDRGRTTADGRRQTADSGG